jgi:predicted CopG family antitoxin
MMTTIQIEKEARESLKKLGYKSESYNDIIERLMNYCEELNLEEMIPLFPFLSGWWSSCYHHIIVI